MLVGVSLMNKRGQTLILFVILIPILLGMAAVVVDVGYLISKNVELKEVSKTIVEEVIDNASEEKIKDLFLLNDIPVENLEVEILDDRVHIENEYEIDSIFGSIIGLSTYQVRVDITGIRENDQVIFE